MTAQKQCSNKKNVLILASGNGSNFEAIVKHFRAKGFAQSFDAPVSENVSFVNFELLCDNKNAPVLKKAEALGVPAYCVDFENFYDFLTVRKGKYYL